MSEQSFSLDPMLDKEERYKEFLPLFKSLLSEDDAPISVLCNAVAALKEAFGFFWVGFYFVSGSELVLGPFQGSVACTRIPKGRGVCGTAWDKGGSLVVADVDQFPGHIACSSLSRSEIVVPLVVGGDVVGVLDVDSTKLNDFDDIDRCYLEEIATLVAPFLINGL